MGLFSFNFGRNVDINEKIKAYEKAENGILLDVRTREEYQEGHIADSVNLPLQEIEKAEHMLKDKHRPIFVYCHSGIRSGQAVSMLRHMGYPHAVNIGGIVQFSGKVVQ